MAIICNQGIEVDSLNKKDLAMQSQVIDTGVLEMMEVFLLLHPISLHSPQVDLVLACGSCKSLMGCQLLS